nr:phosphodiester glycosidase family protein [Wenxinia marina]
MRGLAALLAALFGIVAVPAGALECRDVVFEGQRYTTCEVDPAADDLRTFLTGGDGRTLGSFSTVEAAAGRPLLFAMNAGMYHADRAPVGLYVEDGREVRGIVTAEGPGNFGLLPNGVLCIGDGRARVIESRAFAADPPACRYATQSGPMLVIGGDLHPRFLPDSTSRYVRNGVGTSADGTRAVFAISAAPVTFWEFGRLFRDGLGLPDALYLDGSVSRLHAPSIGRSDRGVRMGPIVGVLGE